MLVIKEKSFPTQASEFRPLHMLDSARKLLEKLRKFRLNTAVENASDFQRNSTSLERVER